MKLSKMEGRLSELEERFPGITHNADKHLQQEIYDHVRSHYTYQTGSALLRALSDKYDLSKIRKSRSTPKGEMQYDFIQARLLAGFSVSDFMVEFSIHFDVTISSAKTIIYRIIDNHDKVYK